MTNQDYIVALTDALGVTEARDLVTEWCNAREVLIDDSGRVFISMPMLGHFMRDDELGAFVSWCKAREAR